MSYYRQEGLGCSVWGELVAELVGGAVGGVAFAIIVLVIYLGAFVRQDVAWALLGMPLGYIIGCPLGVYLVGKRFKEGSFWLSVLGSIVGSILGLGGVMIFALLRYRFSIDIAEVGLQLGFPLTCGSPLLFAIIGFNFLATWKKWRRKASHHSDAAPGGDNNGSQAQ